MEAVFRELESKGKNTVDGILEWVKKAKIVDGVKLTEATARKWLDEAAGSVKDKKLSFDKFKEVLNKFVSEKKQTLEEITKALTGNVGGIDEAAKGIMSSLQAGASKAKDAFCNK